MTPPSVPAQLHRRAATARRVLDGDPWVRDHREDRARRNGETPSAAQITAWVDAANHILGDGLTPILPVEVLRELWRNGGTDRALALDITELTGGAAVA